MTPTRDRRPLVEEACRELARTGSTSAVARIAAREGLAARSLARSFAETVGVTPRQYAEAARLSALKARLRRGVRVSDALFDAGFGSSSRLYEKSDGRLGMTPATYRKGGSGMTIRWATAPCRLGRILVAATEKGVCSVKLGSTDAPLEVKLYREFHSATLVRDDSRLGRWIAALVEELDGGPPAGLPVDIAVSAFREKVYRALLAIPRGETRSYAEVARSIGRPTAVRAVARACATNPVAVVIPCHRVVGSDGRLTGYRWGVARKKAILSEERAAAK